MKSVYSYSKIRYRKYRLMFNFKQFPTALTEVTRSTDIASKTCRSLLTTLASLYSFPVLLGYLISTVE